MNVRFVGSLKKYEILNNNTNTTMMNNAAITQTMKNISTAMRFVLA